MIANDEDAARHLRELESELRNAGLMAKMICSSPPELHASHKLDEGLRAEIKVDRTQEKFVCSSGSIAAVNDLDTAVEKVAYIVRTPNGVDAP